MVKGKVSVTGIDRFGDLQKTLRELVKKDVLVGIPEEASTREASGEINNAELLYIQSHGVRRPKMRQAMQSSIDAGMRYSDAHRLYVQEHGSPLWQIPPRPVLEPAIEDRKASIAKQLAKAGQAALAHDPARLEAELCKAGMLGEAAAKGWFENPKNGWPENAAATKRAKGSDAPLIDTGQLRKAITYVVRDRV